MVSSASGLCTDGKSVASENMFTVGGAGESAGSNRELDETCNAFWSNDASSTTVDDGSAASMVIELNFDEKHKQSNDMIKECSKDKHEDIAQATAEACVSLGSSQTWQPYRQEYWGPHWPTDELNRQC
jgi:hypothetical protein